jgi:hypothetical protein
VYARFCAERKPERRYSAEWEREWKPERKFRFQRQHGAHCFAASERLGPVKQFCSGACDVCSNQCLWIWRGIRGSQQ